jgi:hypothetical protein
MKAMTLLLQFFLYFSCSVVFSQNLSSNFYSYSCFGLSGTSNNLSNFYSRSTVGQFNPISTITEAKFIVRQGFQQPIFSDRLLESKTVIINELSIFPNPNQGIFSLVVKLNFDQNYLFRLVDLNGRLVSSGHGHSNSALIVDDLRQKSPSVYFFQLFTNSGNFLTSRRILVQ